MLQNNPYLHKKSYIPSITKTQINLWIYGFLADWAVMAVMKFFAILLKYPTFEGVFIFLFMSYFYGWNEYKIRVSALRI